jgi:hypothetical protein
MSDLERITLILTAAPNDPIVRDPEYQRGLAAVSGALRDAGILYSQRSMTFDAVGAEGYAIGQYVISVAQIAGPVVGVAVGAWIQGRAGRKVRLKIGEIELEAYSQEDMDLLVDKALGLKAKLAEADKSS